MKGEEEKNPPSSESNPLFLYTNFHIIQNVKKIFVKLSLSDLNNSKVFVESHCNVYSAIHLRRDNCTPGIYVHKKTAEIMQCNQATFNCGWKKLAGKVSFLK